MPIDIGMSFFVISIFERLICIYTKMAFFITMKRRNNGSFKYEKKYKQNLGKSSPNFSREQIEIKFLVVFVRESEDEKSFCRSRSIAMTLVNLFMVDEDLQNEIHSFHSDYTSANAPGNVIVRNTLLAYKKNETELKRQYQLHIVWAGWSTMRAKKVEMEIQWVNLHRPMLTVLYRNRQHCVTNKNRINLQDNGGWRSLQNFVQPNAQLTIGDDLYDFLLRLNDSGMHSFGWRKTDCSNSEMEFSFHFSKILNILYFSIVRGGFLSQDELIKVEADDKKFRDSFYKTWHVVETEKSQSGTKYALSLCFRKTNLIQKKCCCNLTT